MSTSRTKRARVAIKLLGETVACVEGFSPQIVDAAVEKDAWNFVIDMSELRYASFDRSVFSSSAGIANKPGESNMPAVDKSEVANLRAHIAVLEQENKLLMDAVTYAIMAQAQIMLHIPWRSLPLGLEVLFAKVDDLVSQAMESSAARAKNQGDST